MLNQDCFMEDKPIALTIGGAYGMLTPFPAGTISWLVDYFCPDTAVVEPHALMVIVPQGQMVTLRDLYEKSQMPGSMVISMMIVHGWKRSPLELEAVMNRPDSYDVLPLVCPEHYLEFYSDDDVTQEIIERRRRVN